jgi:hypothetical protein
MQQNDESDKPALCYLLGEDSDTVLSIVALAMHTCQSGFSVRWIFLLLIMHAFVHDCFETEELANLLSNVPQRRQRGVVVVKLSACTPGLNLIEFIVNAFL